MLFVAGGGREGPVEWEAQPRGGRGQRPAVLGRQADEGRPRRPSAHSRRRGLEGFHPVRAEIWFQRSGQFTKNTEELLLNILQVPMHWF